MFARPALHALLFCLPFAAGCASYQLQGVVVQGPAPIIMLVKANDPRLSDPAATPLGEAVIEVALDPESLNRKTLGMTITDGQGRFALPIKELGAGFLEYNISVVSRRKGFASTQDVMRMPPASSRLLIIMAPGHDPSHSEWNISGP